MLDKLMPKGYFDSVQREMVRARFAHISTVPIDSTECEYHIPALVARATSMFFHKHGKGFIVMLRYYEHIRDSGSPREGYWTITLYIRYHSYTELLKRNPQWLEDGRTAADRNIFGDLPILGSTELKIDGFRLCSGVNIESDTVNEQVAVRFEESNLRNDALSTMVLARKTRQAFGVVERHLDRNPFFRPCLLDFTPYYCFSGQNQEPFNCPEKLEELFWSRFDWGYFRHLIVKPWGYNFQRKDRAA